MFWSCGLSRIFLLVTGIELAGGIANYQVDLERKMKYWNLFVLREEDRNIVKESLEFLSVLEL